jgi:hypothetical protein
MVSASIPTLKVGSCTCQDMAPTGLIRNAGPINEAAVSDVQAFAAQWQPRRFDF